MFFPSLSDNMLRDSQRSTVENFEIENYHDDSSDHGLEMIGNLAYALWSWLGR